MTATTSATIAGVSVLAREGEPAGHPFDLGLSTDGIEIRRPGRPARHMPWSRVSEWELEQRAGDVVLTLRGDGAVTPLLITGWGFDDLDALLRTVTAGPGLLPPVATPGAVDEVEDRTGDDAGVAEEGEAEEGSPPGRRRARRQWRPRVGAKAALTVALLVALAAAVALVLLQSAGVIHWGFLGPTA